MLKESQEYLIYPLTNKTIYLLLLMGITIHTFKITKHLIRPKKLHINIEQFKEIRRISADY